MAEIVTIQDKANIRSLAVAETAEPGSIAIENIAGTLKQVTDQGVVSDLGGGGGAPTDATYITQTPSAGLSAEQALSVLATGLLWSTTTTGVLTKATAAQVAAASNLATAALQGAMSAAQFSKLGVLYGPRSTTLPDQAAISIDPNTDKMSQYVLPVISQDTTITITDSAANNLFSLAIVRLDISAFTLTVKRSTGATTIYAAEALGVPVALRPFGSGGVWVQNDKIFVGT